MRQVTSGLPETWEKRHPHRAAAGLRLVEERGVGRWSLWQPGLPRWREGKRQPASRVAMATQNLEASFEDKKGTHTPRFTKEAPQTLQDPSRSREPQSREPRGVGQGLPVP